MDHFMGTSDSRANAANSKAFHFGAAFRAHERWSSCRRNNASALASLFSALRATVCGRSHRKKDLNEAIANREEDLRYKKENSSGKRSTGGSARAQVCPAFRTEARSGFVGLCASVDADIQDLNLTAAIV
jgi:hypothetical protein